MSAFIKETIHFTSHEEKTQIAGYFYTPAEGEPRALIQLSHGMCEYVCRYEPMFEVLCRAGFAVCGNDHLGHGSSGADHFGFFAEKKGWECVLQDLYVMNTLGHKKYPGIPCFLLGHSMGSFFARWYGEKYRDTIDGLIISGTGGPSPMMPVGKALSGFLSKVKGPDRVSKLMVSLSTGSYGKHYGEDDPNCWLTRDREIWGKYNDDPRCSFCFTSSAYHDMLTAHVHVNSKKWASALDPNLPILIYSGEDDPVGDFGKGVRKVDEMLRAAGVKDVTLHLYPGARHEMHHETNKEEMFADLIGWIEAHI